LGDDDDDSDEDIDEERSAFKRRKSLTKRPALSAPEARRALNEVRATMNNITRPFREAVLVHELYVAFLAGEGKRSKVRYSRFSYLQNVEELCL
jgi:hypothetical protein